MKTMTDLTPTMRPATAEDGRFLREMPREAAGVGLQPTAGAHQPFGT